MDRFNFDTVTINKTGLIVNRRQGEAEFFSEGLDGKVTLDMVKIEAGSFLIGSPDSEIGRLKQEGPQQLITIRAFYLGKFPVTQAQWQAVMGSDPSFFNGIDLPIDRVSWYDATVFCHKLSGLTGRIYRLPSEAEWEYACRAGTTTPFAFGETITTDVANYNGYCPYQQAPTGKMYNYTTPVGKYRVANAFGLYDMHGNVEEWCQDVWQSRYDLWSRTYKRAPKDGSAWEINGSPICRIVRGGCWLAGAENCRSASRDSLPPDSIIDRIGFRIASSLV